MIHRALVLPPSSQTMKELPLDEGGIEGGFSELS